MQQIKCVAGCTGTPRTKSVARVPTATLRIDKPRNCINSRITHKGVGSFGTLVGYAARGQPMTDGEPVDVCVVGGGLGGLALSIGLQELGLKYLVCEAADGLRTATGTLIGLGDNGMVALEGISPTIPEKLQACSQLTTHSHAHTYPVEGCDGSEEHTLNQMKHRLYTTRWAATQSVLADLVVPDNVRCGHKCSGYSQADDGLIAVHFRDKPDIKARFVVGADGVRSAIRRTMFPKDPGPRWLGFMNWNAVRHVPGSSSTPDSHTMQVIRDKDKEGNFTTSVYLINAGMDYQFWQVRMTADRPEFTNGGSAGGGVPGSKERLLQHVRELGWKEVIQEIEATDESLIYERAMWDRLPLSTWSAAGGKVVLLGDAAHAMYSGPGQGARMAFEDAHQLMVAIKQHWPDVAAVAQRYQEARIQRATMIQNIAAGMCNIPGMAKEFTAFWKQLETPGEPPFTRFMETQRWLNSYPEHMHGLPDGKYHSVENLKAFNEHCAAVAAKYTYTYMDSKPRVEVVAKVPKQ